MTGGIRSPKAVKYPALNVAAATAELVKGILALYPQAQIIPRVVPLEDEEISMEVRLPVREDELSHARDQIHGLVIQLQEEYDVLILVYTIPLHD
jgi:hypothetical protein